jgi:hypothetical protein
LPIARSQICRRGFLADGDLLVEHKRVTQCWVGRFTQPDPTGHPTDPNQNNPYPYAGNERYPALMRVIDAENKLHAALIILSTTLKRQYGASDEPARDTQIRRDPNQLPAADLSN